MQGFCEACGAAYLPKGCRPAELPKYPKPWCSTYKRWITVPGSGYWKLKGAGG